MEISDQSISVIVQGPVVEANVVAAGVCPTVAVADSVRRFLPKAELILSTWEGTNCSGLDFDEVVFSVDPGAYPLNDDSLSSKTNNLNRMLVTTQAGISRCTRPFAIKTRTDTPLLSEPPYEAIKPIFTGNTNRYFSHRVVVSNVYTRNPLERPVLFHLSDLVHFGTTRDLKLLWGAPLAVEPEFTRWQDFVSSPRWKAYPNEDYRFRCAPEQYLVECLIRRESSDLFLQHPGHGNIRLLFKWLRLLASHFTIIPQSKFFAKLPARMEQQELAFDLWQEHQMPWLSKWASERVPLVVQFQAIIAYYETRYRYSYWKFGKHKSRKLRDKLLKY